MAIQVANKVSRKTQSIQDEVAQYQRNILIKQVPTRMTQYGSAQSRQPNFSAQAMPIAKRRLTEVTKLNSYRNSDHARYENSALHPKNMQAASYYLGSSSGAVFAGSANLETLPM